MLCVEPALPSSGAAVLCGEPDSVPVLLTESLSCQREPDSATFLDESLSCVWSEPGSVASIAAAVYSDWRDCVYSVVERLSINAESTESHIDSGGLTQSQGEPSGGGGASGGASASGGSIHPLVNIIVQCSASEQTLLSLCIWYSKQM